AYPLWTNSPRRSCDVLAVSGRPQSPGRPQRRLQSDRIGLKERLHGHGRGRRAAGDVRRTRVLRMHYADLARAELCGPAESADETRGLDHGQGSGGKRGGCNDVKIEFWSGRELES